MGLYCVTVQSCGESVIASAARQSRWRRGVLWGRRCGYGVEIATAPAPRNDNPLNSEQLLYCFQCGPLPVLKSGAEGNFPLSLRGGGAEGREHEADFVERQRYSGGSQEGIP